MVEMIGKAIAIRRTELGMSVRTLASLAELAASAIDDFEAERRNPSPRAEARLASALRTTPDGLRAYLRLPG